MACVLVQNKIPAEHLGEPSNEIFGFFWDFGPTGRPPLPQSWDTQNKKKMMFFCILGYSKHIIFSWKSHIFWVIGDFYVIFYVIFGEFLVGTGEPPPYCDNIPTFMGISKEN